MAENPQAQDSPLLLRAPAATKLLGLQSAKTLYRWLADGVIPAAAVVRAGAAIYFKREGLIEWASSNGVRAKPRMNTDTAGRR